MKKTFKKELEKEVARILNDEEQKKQIDKVICDILNRRPTK